jgi:hypothetical protein
MSDRVTAGDRIYAEDYNRLNDSVESLSRISGSGGVKVGAGPGGISLRGASGRPPVKYPVTEAHAINTSGVTLLAHQPAGIIGEMYTGQKGQNDRVLKIRTPETEDEGFWAICAEAIKPGRVGKVYVAGVCLVRLKNPGGEWTYEVTNGNSFLEPKEDGSAQRLTVEEQNAEVHLALIRFPFGGGGGGTLKGTKVKLAATANVNPTTNSQVDSTTPNNGDLVLLKNQTVVADRMVWKVNTAGDWTRVNQPEFVIVSAGVANRLNMFVLSATNTYSALGAVYL